MILFIDTHDSLVTVALKTSEKTYIKQLQSESTHSVICMPLIDELFKEARVEVKNLTKIIVVNGPGSFTGIRIGLSIAKTLSYALNVNISTISSLDMYLISDESKEEKMAVISDNKGYYIKAVKEKEVLIEESYVQELPNYKQVNNEINVDKIIKEYENKESENPHTIKANYIKKINVEEKNDK